MQEEQYVTGSLACLGIHLNGTALLAADHLGMRPDDLNRPVHTAAIGDNELKLTWLGFDAVEAGKNASGFVQRRDNNGDFHGSTEKK